ncbi:MAG: homoaconitate hydratase, partial [Candidatus Heimdallarchaeota archaeon]|nr:homoaconitate hydratase [Candidatus Heimdallarchaeota archaeon]
MALTLIEKILANHSGNEIVKPGEIVDIEIDVRAARDFGGANVVKNLLNNGLEVDDVSKTFFTFDCNPTGSDQKYAENQQFCRNYAREKNIKIYDVNAGIGTHLVMEEGLATPGSTVISTDSHANILGAVGAFGQGMGDQDIAAAWASGKIWFKVPETLYFKINGKLPEHVMAKDLILKIIGDIGTDGAAYKAMQFGGSGIDEMSVDER